ncbi:MAG TPA: c-type cytochrome [Polyangiaceae bacterium]
MRLFIPLLAALPLFQGCDAGSTGAAGKGSSSIAVLASGEVAVVNPDQGSVSFLDPETLAVRATVDVGGEPHSLLELRSGEVLVATYRGGEIVAIDPKAAAVVARSSPCAGPWGLAASGDGATVVLACEWDGSVVRVDPATLTTTTIASGLRRPRAVAVAPSGDVWVADWVGGMVHDFDAAGVDHASSLVPDDAPSRPALTKMSANLAAAIVPAFGSVFVAHVLENNTGDMSEPVADDYGTIDGTNPKINPIVTAVGGAQPISYAVYDGGSRVYSGPSAMAAFGDHELLVAHVSSGNVAVIDTSSQRAVATYKVGFGPSGIAVDAAHHVAFVDDALDGSVSRIDLSKSTDASAPKYDADVTLVRQLPSPFSPAALAGRRFFFDATDPHVTPAGVVACASCHPGGSDDGLVWLEHTSNISLRRRRTKNLANARTSMAPFHWDAQFSDMSALAAFTMTNLMGGDGLLVDVSNVQAFVDEIVKPAVLLPTDAAAVGRGAALFQSFGCVTCHAGADYTDRLTHAVLVPESLTSDDAFAAADTPGLRGIFANAPYFHDGRAADLDAVLHSAMGNADTLTDDQRADLVAFLRSL